MRRYDAHNHLQDLRLQGVWAQIAPELGDAKIAGAVVNGTREEDWEAVARLASEHVWVWPSFGLHPWHVAERSGEWLAALARFLERFPRAGVGEIGLDRWVHGHHLPTQRQVLEQQLELAAQLRRPVTLHCLQAWGALEETLRASPALPGGFLLHAYGGPAEMAGTFLERGAYFSFSPYFLHDRKQAARDIFRELPLDRLLVETDAPEMCPPQGREFHPLQDAATGARLNHPGHLHLAYAALATLRGLEPAQLAAAVEENFLRLFGGAGPK